MIKQEQKREIGIRLMTIGIALGVLGNEVAHGKGADWLTDGALKEILNQIFVEQEKLKKFGP